MLKKEIDKKITKEIGEVARISLTYVTEGNTDIVTHLPLLQVTITGDDFFSFVFFSSFLRQISLCSFV